MRHPLFAAACTLSAAIAYVDGWRVVRPREWGLKQLDGVLEGVPMNGPSLPLTWRDDITELTLFFAGGGELEHLADQQRFRVRRIIADVQRAMTRVGGRT